MHTIEHIRELFAYNDWANRRVIVALKNAADSPEVQKCTGILTHLLIAEREYFERLYGKDSTGMNFWPNMTIAECGELAREIASNYERLLRRFDEEGLDIRAKYRSSEGIPYENTYRELLTHVLFHSAIHRGNIIIKLSEAGHEPPKTDHIFYLRETKYI